MGDWNLGSVAAFVLGMVDGVPTTISGNLLQIADQQRQYVSDRVGVDIGSSSIPITYQSVIWKFTAAETCNAINLVGTKAQSTSLGDFSITKGNASAALTSAQSFRDSAKKEMEQMGTKVKFYKALG
jgi:hypothetical protein